MTKKQIILSTFIGFFFAVGLSFAWNATWNGTDWITDGGTINAQEIAENFEYLKSEIDSLSATLEFGGDALMDMQVFDVVGSHTWTRPSGVTSVRVVVIGGGGAGGGTGPTSRGAGGKSGGAGGYSESVIDVSEISSSAITVGSGGAGRASTGLPGGLSSWSDGTNTLIANGGAGGSSRNSGAGGTASGGDINVDGYAIFGYYGAGGAGNGGSGIYALGGDGKSGIVIVYEYYGSAN